MRAIRILQSNWLNDEVGGDRNTVKLISDDMAREAVETGIAEYAPEYDTPGTRAAAAQEPAEPLVVEFPAELSPSPEFQEQAAEFMNENDALLRKLDDDPPADLKMPWSNASKADWISWAAHGNHGQPHVSEEVAATLTKNELMSRYGERL